MKKQILILVLVSLMSFSALALSYQIDLGSNLSEVNLSSEGEPYYLYYFNNTLYLFPVGNLSLNNISNYYNQSNYTILNISNFTNYNNYTTYNLTNYTNMTCINCTITNITNITSYNYIINGSNFTDLVNRTIYNGDLSNTNNRLSNLESRMSTGESKDTELTNQINNMTSSSLEKKDWSTKDTLFLVGIIIGLLCGLISLITIARNS